MSNFTFVASLVGEEDDAILILNFSRQRHFLFRNFPHFFVIFVQISFRRLPCILLVISVELIDIYTRSL